MNAAEALTLCRLAKAMCPQQAVDEFTPDAWHMLLEDIRFDDAKAALVVVARIQPFVAPAEIRTAVKKLRGQRLLDFGPLPEPPDLPLAEEFEWIASAKRLIADGTVTTADQLESRGVLVERHMPELQALMRRVEP